MDDKSFYQCVVFADPEWHWRSIDDTVTEPLNAPKLRKVIIPKYDLCLTGEVQCMSVYVCHCVYDVCVCVCSSPSETVFLRTRSVRMVPRT